MADLTPVADDVLAGKYRVERVLGKGGMGVVVEATHLQLGQRVALKFMTTELKDNESVLQRFAREARAVARLEGEHVARVYDFGELPDGAPYIVMEYLEGEDLSDLLDREGPQDITRAADLVLQACVGLAEAHAAGIVHRDIKPANLFLARRKDGRTLLKVLDFGISKLTDDGPRDVQLTQGTQTIGSPMYMSPEQIESVRTVDHRTDIWALGAVLYELVTGAPPFVADSTARVLSKVLTEKLTPMAAARSSVPAELDAVVAHALTKVPEDRFATIADFAVVLVPFGSSQRARTLSAATTRIIATSPLMHDALPKLPPPVLANLPGSTLAGPAAAPTVRGPAYEHAETLASEGALGSATPPEKPDDVRRPSAAEPSAPPAEPGDVRRALRIGGSPLRAGSEVAVQAAAKSPGIFSGYAEASTVRGVWSCARAGCTPLPTTSNAGASTRA